MPVVFLSKQARDKLTGAENGAKHEALAVLDAVASLFHVAIQDDRGRTPSEWMDAVGIRGHPATHHHTVVVVGVHL